MVSVKFVDSQAARAKKTKARNQILEILNTNPKWYESEQLTKKVRKLSLKIGCLEMGGSHPIESIDLDTFTQKEYQALKSLGYTDKEVYKALGISKSAFDIFKGVKK